MASHREPGGAARVPAAVGLLGRKVVNRVRHRIEPRRADPEIRQLRSLQRAYRGPSGPEVLLFGDSAMFWYQLAEADRRNLGAMVRDGLGGDVEVHTVVGPGYGPRIVLAFLTALEKSPSRPKVVVVPTSLFISCTGYLAHPQFSYEVEAKALRQMIAEGDGSKRRLPRPTQDDWDRYDRLPAPSLYGARRTFGEIRLITGAIPASRVGLPTTNWQRFVRVRHLYDLSNAEVLTPDSEGVHLAAELGSTLASMGLAAVAYIPPVDHESIRKVLGDDAIEHIRRNAELLERTFLEAGGAGATMVNSTFDCPAEEFSDPAHLTDKGRARFAAPLATAIRERLATRVGGEAGGVGELR
jgi:lysophospholipase L1-like esterase